MPGYPDLNVISNVGRTTPPRSVFHIDTSYVRQPPAYTALRAVAIPVQGGQTLFTNQYRAAQTLPADVRERLQGRSIRHVVTGVDPGDAQARDMIEFLYAHSTDAANTYRHVWSPGDVVMWDNRCVLHRADHSGVAGDRVMHRGMVAAYGAEKPPR